MRRTRTALKRCAAPKRSNGWLAMPPTRRAPRKHSSSPSNWGPHYGHPRPLGSQQASPGAATATKRELLDFYVGKVAKWWIPDDVIFFDGPLPLTGTGKISKLELRKLLLDDYVLPAK